MQQDVYADLLFLINFSMDYLCLYICAKILHRKMYLSKMIIASVIGGAYSVISLFLIPVPIISFFIDCLVCLIMCAIVFSDKQRGMVNIFVCAFLYTGISMMTGGCMTAIFNWMNKLDLPLGELDDDGISTYLFALLALISGIISLKSTQLISKRSNVRECRVNVEFNNTSIEFIGFADSGNFVKDPFSNKPIIFVDRKVLQEKIDISFIDKFMEGKINNSPRCKNIRLISINTAGGKNMVAAFQPDSITIEIVRKNKCSSFVCDAMLSPIDMQNRSNEYNAIVPCDILK